MAKRRISDDEPGSPNGTVDPDQHEMSQSPPPQRRDGSESRMQRIAGRAHEIYEARGGEHGKALEDWLQAEREVDDDTR
jgi:hypothetical protein